MKSVGGLVHERLVTVKGALKSTFKTSFSLDERQCWNSRLQGYWLHKKFVFSKKRKKMRINFSYRN